MNILSETRVAVSCALVDVKTYKIRVVNLIMISAMIEVYYIICVTMMH
jgi:hypothetical protein